MFVIKYDKVSMVKLVQCIERNPAIYNTDIEYTKYDIDKAWDRVALEIGEKDSLCRERWHSIKSCYIRHLKYTAVNSKRKPYYLSEYLEFFKPFVTNKIKDFISAQQLKNPSELPNYLKQTLPQRETAGVNQSSELLFERVFCNTSNVVKTEIVNDEDSSHGEWSINFHKQQPSTSKQILKNISGLQETSQSLSTKVKSQPLNSSDSDNEDVKFLKSLLPEVGKMSSHQKLKFKQEALSIIEDILYASDEINVME